jgi:hypothetical protein
MSYDYQLYKYLEKNMKGFNNFLGIFPSDKLPKNPPPNSSLIANYSSSDQAGTHWIAISGLNSDKVYFFDSYGFDPDDENLLLKTQSKFVNYIKNNIKKGGRYYINPLELQSLDADTCGEYAVKFILDGMPQIDDKVNKKWDKYVNSLSSKQNDIMIKKEINLRNIKI